MFELETLFQYTLIESSNMVKSVLSTVAMCWVESSEILVVANANHQRLSLIFTNNDNVDNIQFDMRIFHYTSDSIIMPRVISDLVVYESQLYLSSISSLYKINYSIENINTEQVLSFNLELIHELHFPFWKICATPFGIASNYGILSPKDGFHSINSSTDAGYQMLPIPKTFGVKNWTTTDNNNINQLVIGPVVDIKWNDKFGLIVLDIQTLHGSVQGLFTIHNNKHNIINHHSRRLTKCMLII